MIEVNGLAKRFATPAHKERRAHQRDVRDHDGWFHAMRDVSFQVASDVTYQQLFEAAKEALSDSSLLTSIEPLGTYQPESGETKNITFRFTLGSYDKTLTGDEVNKLMTDVTEKVTTATDGRVV